MNQFLWITRWDGKRKKSAVANQQKGLSFLSTYSMRNFKRVLSELWEGLNMKEGSNTSKYLTFIPPKGNEVIKIRISDHSSSPQEWGDKEQTGLPNRRYSIVIFSEKSMPNESNQRVKESEWENYMAQNIPTYEKRFNRYYLNETFDTLKGILMSIYQGGCPEDNTLRLNITEIHSININPKKKIVRLTESQLREMIKESVIQILNEETSQQGNKEIMSDLVRELQTWGNLDVNDHENYKKWGALSIDERLKVLEDGKFTGMLSSEEDLDFANLYRATTKEDMLGILQDELQNKKDGYDMEDTNHYILKFKGIDKVVFSCDLDKPLTKTQIQKLEYISACGGLSNYRYWVVSQAAKVHLMNEMGFIEYIDGRIVNSWNGKDFKGNL